MISVITVSYRDFPGLKKTIESFDCQDIKGIEVQHLVIASGYSQEEKDCLTNKYYNPNANRNFAFDKDCGLYNAMNLGLKKATGNFVFFLNGGDEFYSDQALRLLSEKSKSNCCVVFRTAQCWKNDYYLRPGKGQIERSLRYPAHQGFLAPLDVGEIIFYDEGKVVDADLQWMRENIRYYDVIVCEEILSTFHLGGVSNFPSLRSMRKRYESQGGKRAFFEGVKFLIRLLIGTRSYYYILSKRAGYEHIRL